MVSSSAVPAPRLYRKVRLVLLLLWFVPVASQGEGVGGVELKAGRHQVTTSLQDPPGSCQDATMGKTW